jgi:hypothetical protein
LAEHIGVSVLQVTDALHKAGSLIPAIEALRSRGRSLTPYVPPNLGEVEKWLADNEVFDPEGPEEMFEAFSNRGLLRRLGKKIAPGTSGALSSQRKASSSSWPSQT